IRHAERLRLGIVPANGRWHCGLFERVGVKLPSGTRWVHLFWLQILADRIQVAGAQHAIFADKAGSAFIEDFMPNSPVNIRMLEGRPPPMAVAFQLGVGILSPTWGADPIWPAGI